MRKPPLPQVPRSAIGTDRRPFDEAIKETLEVLTGVRAGRIAALRESASLDDVIAKINEIIARLQ